MSRQRWLLTGTWRGYRSSQDRAVHRQIITSAKDAVALAAQHSILFTDGTTLELSLRPLSSGERVKEPMVNGYGQLIGDCLRHDVWSVQGLCDLRKASA